MAVEWEYQPYMWMAELEIEAPIANAETVCVDCGEPGHDHDCPDCGEPCDADCPMNGA